MADVAIHGLALLPNFGRNRKSADGIRSGGQNAAAHLPAAAGRTRWIRQQAARFC